MLSHLNGQLCAVVVYFYCVKKIGKVILFKSDIHNGSDYLNDRSNIFAFHLFTAFQNVLLKARDISLRSLIFE